MRKKKILIAGSLAYDHIMNFDDRFKNHILPDKIHILNVSFNANKFEKLFGGTGPSIGYNLTLLGEKPILTGKVGKDFSEYKKWLQKNRFDISDVKVVKNDFSASCYIITDQDDNQITSFYPGAINKTRPTIKSLIEKKKPDLGILSPTHPPVFKQYAKDFYDCGVSFIFDPGQVTPALKRSEIKYCIEKAMMMTVNDYEFSLIKKKTDLTLNQLKKKLEYLIITLGPKGSIIYHKGKKFEIPPAKPKNTSDPTGAGDAFRAGIIKGLLYDFDPMTMGQLGSVASVYTVEKYGTQAHRYTLQDFKKRFRSNFGKSLNF